MTTTSPVPFDFQLPTAQLLHLASTVSDEQLVDPTPCDGRTISQLLGHVSGLLGAFRATADKDLGPWTDTNPDDGGWPQVQDGWRDELARRGPALVEAWAAPEAWQGMTRAGGQDLPGQVAGMVALDEVTLHGWDLARATGHDYTCDDASAQALLDFVSGFDAAGTPGLFGPAVEIAADAGPFDRVLARAGRQPWWQPRADG
jgi:uncharacterized protein (TIGR03086 family)